MASEIRLQNPNRLVGVEFDACILGTIRRSASQRRQNCSRLSRNGRRAGFQLESPLTIASIERDIPDRTHFGDSRACTRPAGIAIALHWCFVISGAIEQIPSSNSFSLPLPYTHNTIVVNSKLFRSASRRTAFAAPGTFDHRGQRRIFLVIQFVGAIVLNSITRTRER